MEASLRIDMRAEAFVLTIDGKTTTAKFPPKKGDYAPPLRFNPVVETLGVISDKLAGSGTPTDAWWLLEVPAGEYDTYNRPVFYDLTHVGNDPFSEWDVYIEFLVRDDEMDQLWGVRPRTAAEIEQERADNLAVLGELEKMAVENGSVFETTIDDLTNPRPLPVREQLTVGGSSGFDALMLDLGYSDTCSVEKGYTRETAWLVRGVRGPGPLKRTFEARAGCSYHPAGAWTPSWE